MKKILIILFALCFSVGLNAQQTRDLKRSKSVFLYPDFKVARVNQTFGRHVTDTINIFLKDASLCFRRSDKVLKAYTGQIIGLEIDSVKYRKVGEQMARVVMEYGPNMLLCVTTVDMDILKEETYGAEAAGFFDLDIPGTNGVDVNTFMDLSGHKREEDEGYPLKNEYYFLIKGVPVVANETQVKKYVREDMKEAWKNKMADRFWSWKDPKSLSQILIYLPQ